MDIKNVLVSRAGLRWKVPKVGMRYKEASISLEVQNLAREHEDKLGYHGAVGHLINLSLSWGEGDDEKVVVSSCPVKSVSSTWKVVIDGEDPKRITTISLNWNDEWGELNVIGENLLGAECDASIQFLQGELPIAA